MKKNFLFLSMIMLSFSIIFGGILFSCSAPGASSDSGGSNGSLAISINDSVSTDTAPAVGGLEEDIFPTISMNPASYHIAGLGPNGATFEETTTSNSKVINALAFGDWTLTITALNVDGISIGVGSSTTTVQSNATSMVNVIVTPYDGLGTLNLSLAWTAGDVNTPQVVSTLQPNAGLTRNLDFTIAGASASFSAADVPTGYHTLVLKLLDNGILTMGAVDVVRIVADNTTSGSFLFDKINKATGTIEVGITPEMGDPLAVEITGGAETKAANDTMSLTASVTNYADNVNYVWYVNGDSVDTGDTFDFDETWAQGYYRIDVTAYNTDGSRAGSEGVFVEVGEIVIPTGPAFVTTWKTDNLGDTGDNQIRLPLIETGSYEFVVDWGDGTSNTITSWDSTEKTHTYITTGTYTVTITGKITGWSFVKDNIDDNISRYADSQKILEISNWGGLNLGEGGSQFSRCLNLIITATDMPDLSNVTSLSWTFFKCTSLTEIPNINNWDISSVSNLNAMFYEASSFNQDLSGWDTSNVTDMQFLFSEATAFNGDVTTWNTSKVETMSALFQGCTVFNQDISGWDTTNVTRMTTMFGFASSFNQDISGWDVSGVHDFGSMFVWASSFNQDLSGWDTTGAYLMGGMFRGATAFNADLSSWDVSNVERFDQMFEGATSFSGDVSSWDVSSGKYLSRMFANATSFDQDLSGWELSSNISITEMFEGVTLSTSNYDAILIAWESLYYVPSNIEFGGGNSQYSAGAAAAARQRLIDDHGWTITDGGQTP